MKPGMSRKALIDLAEEVLGKRAAFLNTSQFAQITGLSPSSIRAYCADETISTLQNSGYGSHYRIPIQELAKFI